MVQQLTTKVRGMAPAGLVGLATGFLSPSWSGNSKLAMSTLTKVLVESVSGEALEAAATDIVENIKAHHHSTTFDEADYMLRNALFNWMCECERYHEGATVLAMVNLDSQTRPFDEEEKADIYIKCAEACLAEDASVDAEVMANKASVLMNAINKPELMLRYKVTHARVLDSNRKFLDAAMKYYDVSKVENDDVDASDLMELLGKAVTCTLLAKAGPQRSRFMGLLYKDERVQGLEHVAGMSSHAAVLAKMYTEQFLQAEELSTFEASLKPHQQATTSEGYTIIEKAMMEHNVHAAGKIYDNIHVSELGHLLKMSPQQAEKMAAKMISEGRLRASIDQVEGLLEFEEDNDPIKSWDERIEDVCTEVSNCVTTLQAS